MSDEYAAWSSLVTGAHVAATSVTVICDIVLVVVIATVVRRHRPDAWGSLLAWSVTVLGLAIVWPVIYAMAFAVVARTDGVASVYKTQVTLAFLGIPIHLIPFFLLLRGLVKLAQPAKVPVNDPVGPYR